jgi:predicted  nucleic acid-binding Zn-ribbon protein
MLNEQELLKIKQDIETAKTEVSQLKGKLQHLMEQLEKDWKCKTIEDAQKKLSTIDREITQLDEKIKKQTKELEEKYFEEAN